MAYVSPEQIRGDGCDIRSDLYAFGCVAYHCLTGAPPFVRDDHAALLWAHLAVDPPPVSAHRGDLAAADTVMARCLAKSPADRYATCGQFVEALAEAARTGRHRSAPVHDATGGRNAPPIALQGSNPLAPGGTGPAPQERLRRSCAVTTVNRQPPLVLAGSPATAPSDLSERQRPPAIRRRTLFAVISTLIGVALALAIGVVVMQETDDGLEISEPAAVTALPSVAAWSIDVRRPILGFVAGAPDGSHPSPIGESRPSWRCYHGCRTKGSESYTSQGSALPLDSLAAAGHGDRINSSAGAAALRTLRQTVVDARPLGPASRGTRVPSPEGSRRPAVGDGRVRHASRARASSRFRQFTDDVLCPTTDSDH